MQLAFVKQSVSTVVDGRPVRLTKGDAWDASDVVVKGRSDLFADRPEDVKSSVEKPANVRGVEQASAVPGEKRAVTKKTAAKK